MAPGSPSTPPDDARDVRSADPDAPPKSRPPRSKREESGSNPPSPTTDEISVLLSTSMQRPEPDPMLGGTSSWDLPAAAEPSRRSRSADALDIVVASRESGSPRPADSGAEPGVAWSRLLLGSYASALTLALLWMFWTGRVALSPPTPREPQPARRRASEAAPAADVAPKANPPAAPKGEADAGPPTAALGRSIVVGDLELTPLLVLRRSVRTTRELDDATLVRDHDGCLALTLRLKNRSAEQSLRPLDEDDLRDGLAFTIDSPPGPEIAMFAMAPQSEWTLEQPTFPTLEPGAVEDVVVVSEPVSRARLASTMTWRLRLRTGGEGPDASDVAVRFSRNDVHGD